MKRAEKDLAMDWVNALVAVAGPVVGWSTCLWMLAVLDRWRVADGTKAAALPVSETRRDIVAAWVQNFIFFLRY